MVRSSDAGSVSARAREIGSVPHATPSAIATSRIAASATSFASRLVALMKDAETHQGEHVVHLLHGARERRDEAREPAGRDDGARVPELLLETIDEPVDE